MKIPIKLTRKQNFWKWFLLALSTIFIVLTIISFRNIVLIDKNELSKIVFSNNFTIRDNFLQPFS